MKTMQTGLESGEFSSPVIVLGMHRSGTSYLAGFAGAWGMSIGQRLLPSAMDNPRGYFEDEEFVRFHGDVLQRACGQALTNHALGPMHFRTNPKVALTDEERRRGAALAAARRGFRFWGWKDPRTCLFLEFWRSHFPEAALVAVYRHPLEVWGSEVRRRINDLSFDSTILIDSWTVHNRAILDAWRVHRGPKVLFGAGAVFGDTPRMEALLARVLGRLPEDRRPLLPAFASEEFQDWRISTTAHECFADLFPAAAAVYAELQAAAAARLDFASTAEPWCASFREHCRAVLAHDEVGRRFLLPLLAARIHPSFVPDWAALQHKVESYWAAQVAEIRALRGQADHLLQRLADWRRREQEGQARRRAAEESRTVLGAEVTEWRARFLAASAAEPAQSGRPVYLWADNTLAARVRALLAERGIAVARVVDRRGPPAISPDQLAAQAGPSALPRPYVVVCSASARDEICAALRGMGMETARDFVALPDLSSDGGALSDNPRP